MFRSCLGDVSVMSWSCLDHVSVWYRSCFGSVSVLFLSCLSIVMVLSLSCFGGVSVFFCVLLGWCLGLVLVMFRSCLGHVSVVSRACVGLVSVLVWCCLFDVSGMIGFLSKSKTLLWICILCTFGQISVTVAFVARKSGKRLKERGVGGREKLGLFCVWPQIPFASEMLKVHCNFKLSNFHLNLMTAHLVSSFCRNCTAAISFSAQFFYSPSLFSNLFYYFQSFFNPSQIFPGPFRATILLLLDSSLSPDPFIQYTITSNDLPRGSPINLPLANWNIISLASECHVRSWAIASRPLHSEASAFWKNSISALINFHNLILVAVTSAWFEFQSFQMRTHWNRFYSNKIQ